MKSSIIKKITVATSIICMCFSFVSDFCIKTYAALPDNEIIAPQYIAIYSCDCSLTKSAGGLKCKGATYTSSQYTAGVFVELQQYNGGWETVKSWSEREVSAASVSETYYPASGYTYRVRTIHQAYNSSGTLVEIDTTYSNEVYY